MKYVLTYTSHTDIKHGDRGVYSTEKVLKLEFAAVDDTEAVATAKQKWKHLMLHHQQPNAAIYFVGLARKIGWAPRKKFVQWDSSKNVVQKKG